MALYHTHRPQDFDSIVGQTHIKETIKNQIKTNKVAHAYLFSGPRGVGKTTTARVLAKAANCIEKKEKEAEPCNQCEACNEIMRGNSIDVIELDAASHTGVDNVRENIIENAQFKPTKLKKKVFIIDEVHMLSTSAFNALLKTLEEPPEHVIFVLATTEKHKLPETIISRCQRFDFKKIPYEEMKAHIESIAKLEKVKLDKEVIDRIINKGDGCARDAVSLLDQLLATGEKNISTEIAQVVLPTSNVSEILKFVENLLAKDSQACLDQINQTLESGANLNQFAHDIIEILRNLLVIEATGDSNHTGLDLSKEANQQMNELKDKISKSELVFLLDLFIKRKSEIKSAPIPQLPLELAVVEWCNGETRDNEQGTINKQQETNSEQLSVNQPSAPARQSLGLQTMAGGDHPKGDSEQKLEAQTNEQQIENQKLRTKNQEPGTENQELKTEIKEKISLKEKVKKIVVNKEPNFSLETAKEAWEECIKKIEAHSPSLVFVLKLAEVLEVQGSDLGIKVQYSFHKDKLEEKQTLPKIQEVLSEILDTKVKLKISVQEGEPEQKNVQELQDLTSAFGGEIVG